MSCAALRFIGLSTQRGIERGGRNAVTERAEISVATLDATAERHHPIRTISRLEKLLFRLEAQCAALAWAFADIAGKDGVVFELGLGLGRTYDHIRRNLPDRQLVVFDRSVDSYPDCTPPDDDLVLGDLSETLPRMAAAFSGRVILAHTDVGSFSANHNSAMSTLVSNGLASALAPGALVLSDLPLSLPGTVQLPLPLGAREGRYYIYRRKM
jgi:hypothetical protein